MILLNNPDHVMPDSYMIPQAFNMKQIRQIKKLSEQFEVKEGVTFERTDPGPKKDESRVSEVKWLEPNNTTSELYQQIISYVNQINDTVFKFNLTYLEVLQYTIYNGDIKGKYDWHCDDTMARAANNDKRKLSFSILLSDLEPDQGGQFVFKSSNKDNVVNLKKGDMLFFPSTYMHCVTPVNYGVRNSLVGWVHGPNWT